jgi:hypothetical protein
MVSNPAQRAARGFLYEFLAIKRKGIIIKRQGRRRTSEPDYLVKFDFRAMVEAFGLIIESFSRRFRRFRVGM